MSRKNLKIKVEPEWMLLQCQEMHRVARKYRWVWFHIMGIRMNPKSKRYGPFMIRMGEKKKIKKDK